MACAWSEGTVVDVRWCDETSKEVRDAFKAIDESEGAAGVGQDERDAVAMMRCGAILLTLDTGKTFLAARCVWTPKFSPSASSVLGPGSESVVRKVQRVLRPPKHRLWNHERSRRGYERH